MNKIWCETQWSTDVKIETKRIYGRSHYFFNISNSKFKTLTTKRPYWFIEPTEKYELLESGDPIIYTMDEVRPLFGSSGYKSISLFSGTGGSSLGIGSAGFDVQFASEFIPEARSSYLGNFPDTYVDDKDVRLLQPYEILDRIGIDVGELDMMEGSPPCSPFSSIGSRENKWNEINKYSSTEQRTDDLFFEYLRILRGLKPRTFIAENVSGLTIGKARGYLKMIIRELTNSGYKVKTAILDSSHYGTPQDRRRLFIVGIRNDIKEEFHYPRPTHHIPVLAHAVCRDYVMMDLDGDRQKGMGMPIKVAKRVQSFPEDFFLDNSEVLQFERIGRAVPPIMMRRVAENVRKVLDSHGN